MAPEALGDGRGQDETQRRALARTVTRTRPVQRQPQRVGGGIQPGLPVRQLCRQPAGGIPFALPYRIVAELDRQGRERRRLSGGAGGIAGGQVFQQHILRPSIGQDVVDDDGQPVRAAIQADERHAPGRRHGQVERPRREIRRHLAGVRFALPGRQAGDVQFRWGRQGRRRGQHPLHGCILFALEHGAQHGMPRRQVGQRLAQRAAIQRSLQRQQPRHVVGVGLRVHAPGQPQPLLRIGQGIKRRLREGRDGQGGNVHTLPGQAPQQLGARLRFEPGDAQGEFARIVCHVSTSPIRSTGSRWSPGRRAGRHSRPGPAAWVSRPGRRYPARRTRPAGPNPRHVAA
ncbi:hypothetical protein BOBR111200_23360 [Bordetella bronchialis]